MALRAKSKRRLIILSSIFLGLCLLAGGAYLVRMHLVERNAQQARVEGVRLYEQGEYEPALHKIGTYLSRHKRDTAALYMYAVCRREVEQPGRKHLVQAAQLLQRVLAQDPAHNQAARDLLELYDEIAYATESLELADRLLVKSPEDPAVLRLKARALVRLQHPAKALPVSQKVNELNPGDLDSQILTLSLMRNQRYTRSQMIEHGRNLRSKHPGDPRFLLLEGVTHMLAGKGTEARDLLLEAAEADAPDAQYVVILVQQLNRLGLFHPATAVLEARHDFESPELRMLRLRRLFELGRYADLVKRSEDLSWTPNLYTRSRAQTLRAMSLLAQDKRAQAVTAVKNLRATGGVVSQAWAPILHMQTKRQATGIEFLKSVQASVTKLPQDPFLRVLLAETLLTVGEPELALTEMLEATKHAAGWARPFVRASQLQLMSGQYETAAKLAQQGLQRNPQNPLAALAFAQAQANRLSEMTPEQMRQFDRFVTALADGMKDNATVDLLRVDLAARLRGRDEAATVANELLARPEMSDMLIGGLRGLNSRHELGLEDKLPETSLDPAGVRPSQAFAQVLKDADPDDPAATLRAFKRKRKASKSPDSLAWDVASARLAGQLDPDKALDHWRKLLEENPESIAACKAALDAQAVWGHPQFVQKVIDRLRSLTPEEGLAWKIAQARLLMQSNDAADLKQAGQLLTQAAFAAPYRIEPRMMLVECLNRQGNYAGAVQQIGKAIELSDRPDEIRLLQARLVTRHGDREQARHILVALADSDSTRPAVRRRVAATLAAHGDLRAALAALEPLHPGEDTPADLQVARYLLAAGEADRAEAIARKLTTDQPTPQATLFFAELLAVTDRLEQANRQLEGLEKLEVPASEAMLIRARFAERYESAERAETLYRKAIETDLDKPRTHLGWVQYLLRNGNGEELSSAVERAVAVAGDLRAVRFLHENSKLLAATVNIPAAREFWMSALADPDNESAALEGARLARTIDRRKKVDPADLAKVRRLAERYPRLLPMQVFAARLSLSMGKTDDAITWAKRATQSFPDAVEPAWILSEALAAEGRWAEAMVAARKWRRRSRGRQLAADMMIAEGHIRTGNARGAIAQLKSHVDRAMESPGSYRPVIGRYARALIDDGRTDEAADLLGPLLEKGPGWRRTWTSLAVLAVHDADTSRAWLNRVVGTVPDDAADERVAVAEAWFQLGRRQGDDSCIDRATDMLTPLSKTDPNAAISLAMIHDMQGNAIGAETLYRSGIRRRARDQLISLACNNLAMLLVGRDNALDEAEAYARRAIRSQPGNANYRDTLAEVLGARGKMADAVAMLEKAVELDPVNPKWLLKLAATRLAAGRPGDARKALVKLRRMYPEADMLPVTLQGEFRRLQKRLAS
ncbi:MAG: tetratricopeptide repeat protein [Phycisphaerae bacterium]